MTNSTASEARRPPEPVPVRRYRYSKLRWRVLVHALDAVGTVAMRAWRLVRPARVVSAPRRILVVQLDHMGDAVLSTPLFPRLKAAFPDATIDVLASPSNHAVFEADPHVDRVRIAARTWFERAPGRWALASAVWELGRSLRKERYDWGIDVRGDVLSVFVLALAGIPRRLGWAMGGGGFLLTDVAPWVPGRHEVRSRMALLEALEVPGDEPIRASVLCTDDDRAAVARLYRQDWPETTRETVPTTRHVRSKRGQKRLGVRTQVRTTVETIATTSATSPLDPESLQAGRFGDEFPLLVIHTGAGTAAKRWPQRHWSELARRFLSEGWRVVTVGGADDVPATRFVAPHPNFRDWTGRLGLTGTVALLERADFFIGADSGPAHLAAGLGVPSVVLFSGTNRVRQWRPWSRRSLVLHQRVSCRPCHHKTCPLADHPCLTGITPERVEAAARRWWARLHRAERPHAPL